MGLPPRHPSDPVALSLPTRQGVQLGPATSAYAHTWRWVRFSFDEGGGGGSHVTRREEEGGREFPLDKGGGRGFPLDKGGGGFALDKTHMAVERGMLLRVAFRQPAREPYKKNEGSTTRARGLNERESGGMCGRMSMQKSA